MNLVRRRRCYTFGDTGGLEVTYRATLARQCEGVTPEPHEGAAGYGNSQLSV
jgi:hypothetical protein